MEAIQSLKRFVSLLIILILPATLGVAYFRNYQPGAPHDQGGGSKAGAGHHGAPASAQEGSGQQGAMDHHSPAAGDQGHSMNPAPSTQPSPAAGDQGHSMSPAPSSQPSPAAGSHDHSMDHSAASGPSPAPDPTPPRASVDHHASNPAASGGKQPGSQGGVGHHQPRAGSADPGKSSRPAPVDQAGTRGPHSPSSVSQGHGSMNHGPMQGTATRGEMRSDPGGTAPMDHGRARGPAPDQPAPAAAGGSNHPSMAGMQGGAAPPAPSEESEFPMTPAPALIPVERARLESSRRELEESREELGTTARDLEEPPPG